MESVKLEINQYGDGAFYLLEEDKKLAKMLAGISGKELNVYYTEALIEGKGYAKKLLEHMVAYVRDHEMKVTPYCPYVHAQFRKNPELFSDIWNKKNEK